MEKYIAIVDYGVGNLFSVQKALSSFHPNVVIAQSPDIIEGADVLILPGVGSFKAGMDGLRKNGLLKAVKDFSISGRPILGICLGAQLLMSEGREFGKFKGLGIIPGTVEYFKASSAKIPHIGWSKALFKDTSLAKSDADYYFVHSYIFKPDSPKNILAESVYGGKKFCSAIVSGNIVGVQFHPEKSGKAGLKLIENFVKKAIKR